MRRLALPLIAALLAPLAAHAQRVDTRRIDVEASADHATCRFNAIPELTLDEIPGRPDDSYALWTIPTGDAPHGVRAHMLVIFLTVEERPFGTGAAPLGVWLDPGPAAARVKSLRLEAEGALPSITLEELERSSGPPERFLASVPAGARFFEINSDHWRLLNTHLESAETLALELVTPSGALLGTAHWDVAKFRRIAELIDLVHWSCTSPDRG